MKFEFENHPFYRTSRPAAVVPSLAGVVSQGTDTGVVQGRKFRHKSTGFHTGTKIAVANARPAVMIGVNAISVP